MEWLKILARIQAGESQTTEFKRGLGDFLAVGRAICAFANTEGGVLILGVDETQEIVGVREDTENVQERLTSFLHTGCSTPVSAQSGRHKDPKGWVHWIEVPQQRGFEPLRYDGRVWVRCERSSVEPSPTELQDLYNAFGYILTEERTIQAAVPSDIDIQKFRSFLRAQRIDVEGEPQPPDEDDLRNRGVLAPLGDILHPTLYGILAFGKTPQAYPQTHKFKLICVAYEGTDRASRTFFVSDSAGCLDDQINHALAWLKGLGRFETYQGLRREDRFLLPKEALREALVNAVAHRDYAITGSPILFEMFSDRMEITSPGTLPNHMRIESVRMGGYPRSRNESLAHFMAVMGFMEQRGRGWPVMRRAMREFNGTEPEIVAEPTHVRVTFRLDPAHAGSAF